MIKKLASDKAYYDVLVIGGGTAGVIAAIQSAAAGAETLLLERSSMLGGTMTAGGVVYPGLFHAWGKQIIRGYGWKLVTQCVAECGGTLPDFTTIPEHHWQHQIRINPAFYTLLCDEFVTTAGAEVLFHAMPAQITWENDKWQVTVCTKSGLMNINAGCLIDSTGDANAVTLAGGELKTTENEMQPGTQICHVSGYDMAKLDFPRINSELAAAVDRQEISPYDIGWNTKTPKAETWLRAHGGNTNHIPDIDAGDSWGRSRIELAGRRSVLRVYRFLRRQPGLENLRLDYLAPECGVRETARINGDETVTAADYCSGRCYEDALCYAFYPIDLHTTTGSGLDKRTLKTGVVPTVPRGALLPRGLSRLIVAGRCVSSDREANSALRVQASAMAMGQAAGAMAALCTKTGVEPRKLPLNDIRELLRLHDAILPIL